jgi:RNA polymerase sigma-70 factor (ECF subfamily)
VPELQDEIIMQQVKEGNLAGMSVLFERYHLRIYNFFLKLTMKKDLSEDLTQNLFYRMIKYKNSYKNEYSVKSWIYQIARNLHSDYYRDAKRADKLIMNIESYREDIIDDNGSYDEEDYVRLENAFSALSREQKELLVLSRYQGLKYEEISSITKQSVPAIKVAVYRAIKQLRGIYFKQL